MRLIDYHHLEDEERKKKEVKTGHKKDVNTGRM